MTIFYIQWILMCLVFWQRSVIAAEDSDIELKPALTKCRRYHPCGVTISSYPLLDSDLDESSGFGSGSVPVYDEVLTHEIYNLNESPDLLNSTICSCPSDEQCNFESEDNFLKIDYHVTLRFCDLKVLSSVCKRNVPNLRVIGTAHETGETIQDVSNAIIFCNCPSGFARHSVESWSGSEISLNYKCL